MTPMCLLETRNPALYGALESCIFSVIDFLSQKYREKDVPVRQEFKWIATDQPEFFTLTVLNVPIYEYFFPLGDNSICDIESVKNAQHVIENDAVWGKYVDRMAGSCFGVRTFRYEFFVRELTSSYIKKSKGLFKINDVLSDVLDMYEQEFIKDSIDFIRITPLLGIEFADTMAINEDMALEKLQDAEVVDAIELGVSGAKIMSVGQGVVHGPSRFAIVTRCSVPKVIREENESHATSDEFNKIWTRLCDEEAIAIDLLSMIIGSKVIPTGNINKSMSPVFRYVSYQNLGVPGYKVLENKAISNELMDNLKKLFAMHYNMLLQQHSELIIALRRFSMAMNRDVVADKLLDLMVSAEALFLEGSAELNYRLAVRAAALLGKDSAEKESIYKFFKEMYKIRSKLVHGQMTFKDFAKFYEKHEADIDLLSRYIRESLLKLTELALSNPNKKPLVEWERMLFQKY
jgi:hypothetical protein